MKQSIHEALANKANLLADEDAQEAESLIDKADRALYKAKQSGRNKVCTI